VLKGVFSIGRRPTPENQFGSNDLRQGIIELLLGHRCDGAD
jgi:hypothetical protein